MAVPSHAKSPVLRPESPVTALNKLLSSDVVHLPVVMGSILSKCKNPKLCGPSVEYWHLGEYCPILQELIRFMIDSQPWREVKAY
jgi:hypothetical protein